MKFHVWINNDQKLTLSPADYSPGKLGYPDSYEEKNKLTESIIKETHEQKYYLLKNFSRNNDSFEKMKNLISGMWESLEKKNGPLQNIEITGTANIWGGNYQSDIATWFRLIFKNKTQLYRLEWDGKNKIAGLGGNRIPYPLMFTLNSIAKKEFIGFDAANARTISVNFLRQGKGNKNIMEVNTGNSTPLILYNKGNIDRLPLRSAADFLYFTIKTKGITAAIEEAASIKKSKLSRFDVDEGELNDAGYRLLKENKPDEAVTIFSILVQAFPESSNGYDSLGEAYMVAGNKAEAIRNYEKSLELENENENAKKMIEELSK